MLSAPEVLDHNYLESRCLLLELAATLDRLDRARLAAGRTQSNRTTGCSGLRLVDDPRRSRRHARPRAERILRLFSDPAEG